MRTLKDQEFMKDVNDKKTIEFYQSLEMFIKIMDIYDILTK